jgi:hypothetical protein
MPCADSIPARLYGSIFAAVTYRPLLLEPLTRRAMPALRPSRATTQTARKRPAEHVLGGTLTLSSRSRDAVCVAGGFGELVLLITVLVQ